MRLNVLFFIFCLIVGVAQGGPVSLDSSEILRLRSVIKEYPGAASQLDSMRTAADRALRDTPDPVKSVYIEGHLVKDPKKIRSTAALKDREKIESLGWTWAGTGDERYAAKCREFIIAWAKVNEPDGDAINETSFEPMIVAYDLLRDTFAEPDRKIVDGWLRTKAQTLWNSKFSVGFGGNWYSHRLKIVGLCALVIDDEKLIQNVTNGYRKQIAALIKPDGSTTEFYIRDSLHYQIYSIEPLITLARAMERRGPKLFDYTAANGVTLRSAVDFMVPFADGRKSHTDYAHSTAPADHWRAENGERDYAAHLFSPQSAARMFTRAAWFAPEYGKLASRITGQPAQPFINWLCVMNAAGPRR